MDNNLTKYYSEKNTLDSISITELEALIHLHPLDLMPKILLSNKMDSIDEQELLLFTNDRTFVHYLKADDYGIPSINELRGLLIDPVKETNILSEHDTNSAYSSQKSASEILDDIMLSEALKIKPEEQQETILQDNIEKGLETNEISPPTINLHSEDSHEVMTESSLVKTDNTIENKDFQQPEKTKKPRKKTKKDKYKLKEFNGISEYSKWLLSFKSSDIDRRIKKEQKNEKKRALEESANKSIIKRTGIISDSLADLLASQGHFDESKKMYEQLMLKYPEKSSYFAAKINQIIKN